MVAIGRVVTGWRRFMNVLGPSLLGPPRRRGQASPYTRWRFYAAGNCRWRTVDDSFARERRRRLLPVEADGPQRRVRSLRTCTTTADVWHLPLSARTTR